MQEELSARDLARLVERVFTPRPEDRGLAVLVDLPDEKAPDHPVWRERRRMATEWAERLAARAGEPGLTEVALVAYRNVRANNADLPEKACLYSGSSISAAAPAVLDGGAASAEPEGAAPADAARAGALAASATVLPFAEIFSRYSLFLAPTEFSTTAPLKVAAREFGFRAATMPGFTRAMIPALRLDYGVIGRRVARFKDLLDRAATGEITFRLSDGARHELILDLRHRSAHASGGLLPEPGTAGNLPSGESYIVPYEGERPGDPSRSRGVIPVQFDSDIVLYRIEENLACEVISRNEASTMEARRLAEEPAYGNLAELGLGVLGDFGLQPTGSLLLDEKLGLHVAFGRSEHFGGQVGPERFSSPERVVHIDRVYIPAIQPDVAVAHAALIMEEGARIDLIDEGDWVIDFDA